jgi:hypothetical protein
MVPAPASIGRWFPRLPASLPKLSRLRVASHGRFPDFDDASPPKSCGAAPPGPTAPAFAAGNIGRWSPRVPASLPKFSRLRVASHGHFPDFAYANPSKSCGAAPIGPTAPAFAAGNVGRWSPRVLASLPKFSRLRVAPGEHFPNFWSMQHFFEFCCQFV